MVGAIALWLEVDYPRRFGVFYVIEQQQLSSGTVLGKHAEIDAVATERRAQREAFASVLDGVGGHGIGSPCSHRRR